MVTMNKHFQYWSAAVRVGALALCLALSTACSKKIEEAPAPLPVPAPPKSAFVFDVAKLKSEYGVAVKEPYQPVSHLRHEPYRVAVLATWCSFSLQFLEEAKKDPSIAAEYLMVVYEDEFSRKVRSAVKSGEITKEKADALIDAPENRGKMVWQVDEALKFGLPIYVVKPDTFEREVRGFPTRLLCSLGECAETGLSLIETKSIVRSHPEMIEEVIATLPPEMRARARQNPEALITALAKEFDKQQRTSD